MDTKSLEKNIKTIIKTGSNYGPEYLPVLRETRDTLKRINKGKPRADIYYQLGTLLLKLEDSILALDAFKTGFQLDPSHVNCGTYAALLLEQSEQWDNALHLYQQLNRHDSENILIAERILLICYKQKDAKQVLQLCLKFLNKKLYYPSIFAHLAYIYFDSFIYDKAIEHMKNAINLDKNNQEYIGTLIYYYYKNSEYAPILEYKNHIDECESIRLKLIYANCLAETGQMAASRTYFLSLLKPDRHNYDILGEISLMHYHYERNIPKFIFINKYILKRAPTNYAALTNLALLEEEEVALEYYKQVVKISPKSALCKMNYGNCLIAAGQLKEGFEYYESRIDNSIPFLLGRLKYPQKITNKKIFIWNEQGIGDQIHWAWFLQFLEREHTYAKIQTDERLLPILKRSFPSLNFTADESPDLLCSENFMDYDAEIINASLAKYFIPEIHKAQAEYEKGNTGKPYIFADQNRIKYWEKTLSNLTALKTVGICWRSGLIDRGRDYGYFLVENMVDIFADLDCMVINLQYSYTEEEVAFLQDKLGDRFVNFADLDLKNDQDDIAALMMALDIVFSVGTAVRALSGALGVKTLCTTGLGRHLGKNYNIMMSQGVSVRNPIIAPNERYYLRDHLNHYQLQIANVLEIGINK